MAGRQLNSEDWSPVYQTRIRASLVSKEGRLRSFKNQRAPGTKPPNLPLQPASDVKAPPPSRRESIDRPREPEIIDVAVPETWPARRTKSSSVASRQSEISLGIIDFYMREPTPCPTYSPDQQPPRTTKNTAIDRFDFELPPTPTLPLAAVISEIPASHLLEAKIEEYPLNPSSPPATAARPNAAPAKGYSLFPTIKQVTPPPRHPTITLIDPSTPSHPHPSPTYRPRKESLSSSLTTTATTIITTATPRTRASSLVSPSTCPRRKPVPLRSTPPSSGSSSGSGSGSSSIATPRQQQQHPRRTTSTSTSTSPSPCASLPNTRTLSPPHRSRWSDDTISPPPTGVRTSFGSLLALGRENMAQQHQQQQQQQQPRSLSFFDDDDDDNEDDSGAGGEDVPLRRKFAWSSSGTTGSSGGNEGTRGSWKGLVLCGCLGRGKGW